MQIQLPLILVTYYQYTENVINQRLFIFTDPSPEISHQQTTEC